jgi:SAM-dependent methyltransferase
MWDQRYDRDDYLFGTEPNAFLQAQASRLRAGQSALVVADGEGRNGVWLAQQGLNVTSVEASKVGIAKAERLAQKNGVEITFEHGDLEHWDFPEAAFDVVVAIFIQFAPPALRDRIFAGMRRALKPGGILLLQGYRPKQLDYGTGGPREVTQLYTRDLLETAFGDLDIIALEEHDSEIEEGSGHSGMSALIDLVAQKPRAS